MTGLPLVEQMIVSATATLRDALAVIDGNGQGACFAVADGILVGVLSDGDIRRALMQGAQLDMRVAQIVNKTFVSLSVNTPLEEIQSHLKGKINIIPIVTASGQVVDYACAQRYHQVPLTQPVLDGNELEYVTDCIRTGWISSQGSYVRRFEESFGCYVGSDNALAVSNGTVALHLALATLGIGPGDEVLVPDLTFVAPANAILYAGARPVLVDVDPLTMAIDPDAAERAVTERTKAIVPVHLYGHPAEMDCISALARRHALYIVEDCAEALGSRIGGKHVGIAGDASTFSFFGNKTITTGEGGMVLFKDAAMLERARILRDHGMSRQRRYWHADVGYNYRLTNIQAAIGVAQLERVNEFVERKRWIAEQYRRRLSPEAGLRLPGEIGDVVNSYWLYTILLPDDLSSKRDQILAAMMEQGVEARPVFYPLHSMPPYAPFVVPGESYQASGYVSRSGISLPTGVTMAEGDVDRVCRVLIGILARCRTEMASDAWGRVNTNIPARSAN